jgi:hypothetical protein
MGSRWYNIAVCLLWVISMSWLVSQKFLPPLLVGDPPNYRAIADSRHYQAPIGWKLLVNGKSLGWAVNSATRLPDATTEVRSRVHFNHIPLEELTPGFLHTLLAQIVERRVARMTMDTESSLLIDEQGCLVSFRSALHLPSARNIVRIHGTVAGSQLKLTIRSGEFSYTTETFLPPKALAGDMLSPQACLPGLHEGQSWTVPTYSPLRPPNNPLEILKARVEGAEPIIWNGRLEEAWLVVFRPDPGLGFGSDKTLRGRLWVRRDGTVLRQQVMVFDSVLTFVRLPDKEAAELEGAGARG